MPKLTVNGKEITVPDGTNLIEAAKAAGAEEPPGTTALSRRPSRMPPE